MLAPRRPGDGQTGGALRPVGGATGGVRRASANATPAKTIVAAGSGVQRGAQRGGTVPAVAAVPPYLCTGTAATHATFTAARRVHFKPDQGYRAKGTHGYEIKGISGTFH